MIGYAFSWFEVVNTALTVLFGGGFLITLITLRAQRKRAKGEADQAAALADGTELDNVEKAIRIWREMAQSLEAELRSTREKVDAMQKQIEELQREVVTLRKTSNNILCKVNKMNNENFAAIVEEIKKDMKYEKNG